MIQFFLTSAFSYAHFRVREIQFSLLGILRLTIELDGQGLFGGGEERSNVHVSGFPLFFLFLGTNINKGTVKFTCTTYICGSLARYVMGVARYLVNNFSIGLDLSHFDRRGWYKSLSVRPLGFEPCGKITTLFTSSFPFDDWASWAKSLSLSKKNTL